MNITGIRRIMLAGSIQSRRKAKFKSEGLESICYSHAFSGRPGESGCNFEMPLIFSELDF